MRVRGRQQQQQQRVQLPGLSSCAGGHGPSGRRTSVGARRAAALPAAIAFSAAPRARGAHPPTHALAAEVEKAFGIRCAVLNDFEAVGYGVPVLTDNDLILLNDVPAEDKVGGCSPGVGAEVHVSCPGVRSPGWRCASAWLQRRRRPPAARLLERLAAAARLLARCRPSSHRTHTSHLTPHASHTRPPPAAGPQGGAGAGHGAGRGAAVLGRGHRQLQGACLG